MRNFRKYHICQVLLLLVLFAFSNSCKKSDNSNSPSSTVTDIEGNVYHTVKIGTQTWMVENLKTTKFNDGTPIAMATNLKSIESWHTPKYCWYNNDVNNKDKYGALYNFWAVNPTYLISYYLAPVGWHIPSDQEWNTLITYLGGDSLAGGKMKSVGTIGQSSGLWVDPNTGATNESGFSGLPGGQGYDVVPLSFYNLGSQGFWWTTTENQGVGSYTRWLNYFNTKVTHTDLPFSSYLSIRCVKD